MEQKMRGYGMKDLIYRQSAINAIENTECELLSCEWDELTNAIKQVPSAEQDNDMIHLQKEQEYLRGWEEGREALKQSAVDIVLEYEKRLYEPAGTPEDNEMYSYGRGLLNGIERNLKQLPSVEPKKGQWEEKSVFEGEIQEWQSARCSVCNKYHTTPYLYYFDNFNYCPNCGARMVVEE